LLGYHILCAVLLFVIWQKEVCELVIHTTEFIHNTRMLIEIKDSDVMSNQPIGII